MLGAELAGHNTRRLVTRGFKAFVDEARLGTTGGRCLLGAWHGRSDSSAHKEFTMDDDKHGPSMARRDALRIGHALFLASAIGLTKTAFAADKSNQKLVQYRPHPNNGARCGVCLNFQPPNACKAVAGEISPNGWCLLFAHR